MDNLTLSYIISERIQAADLVSFSQVDWEALIRESQMQGVGPLLYWKLSKSGKLMLLPETVRNSLRAMYSSTWIQNQKMLKELEILTRLFNQASIPVVALKGASFTLTIYPDIGLRPMSDLDLLIPDTEIANAIRIAESLGYTEMVPQVYPGLRNLLKQEIGLVKRGTYSITLELHNSLLQDRSFTYFVPVEWFWEQTVLLDSPSKARFENLRIFTPTANILYVAAHTILKHGHRGSILRQFYDLDRLICLHADIIDWDLLILQAKKFEWGAALYEALSETREYFNTPIPERVLSCLSETTDHHQQLIVRMKTKPASRVLEEYQHMLSLKWYGRILKILELVIPGPAYMRWRYKLKSFWALPLYYLLRWWGILKDAFRTMMILLVKRCHPTNR